MLDQSYYRKTDEIIEHYGRRPASLIPIMQGITDWGNGSKSFQCGDIL